MSEEFDWSATGLGPRQSWPVELRVLVDTCMEAEFPLQLAWGPDLLVVYNRAYIPLLGAEKHPWALGRPSREVWPDLFGVSGPIAERLMREGGAHHSTDYLMILDRHGYPEEGYFTFSQSAIRDADGHALGLFNAVTETTHHVVYERQLHLLGALGRVRTVDDAADPVRRCCEDALRVLSQARDTVPFAAVCLPDSSGRLGVIEGYGYDAAAAQEARAQGPIIVEELATVLGGGPAQVVSSLRERYADLLHPGPIGPLLPDQAVVLPVTVAGRDLPTGVLVLGVNPYRLVNQQFLEFADLAAGQVSALMSDAQAQENERARLRALAELDDAKTEWLQQVSHELRSPLTLLLPPLKDLQSDATEELSPHARSVVDAAVRGGVRLQRMVDALLDVAQADQNSLRPNLQPTDLTGLTNDVVSGFGSTVAAAGLDLQVELPADPVTVEVDPAMWTTIVTNLLSNAVKYTDRGAISVTLRAAGDEVVLEVADTGIGIDAAEQPRIFDRFHRATPRRNGTGLGLAVVKSLLEVHGGSVTVRSEIGRGSTFVVSLDASARPSGTHSATPVDGLSDAGDVEPAAPVKGPDPADRADRVTRVVEGDAAADDAETSQERPRLLLVEDDPDLAGYLVTLFTRDGWEVCATPDAESALTVVAPADPLQQSRFVPDAILTDVMLPGRSGLDLVTLVRHDAEVARVPVIVLTARSGPGAAVEALAAGADDYLSKPFDSAELIARVRAHHELNQVREAALDEAEVSIRRLSDALDSNRTIATAIGVIAGQHGIEPRKAYRVLVGLSQNNNRKLRDIAADVLAGRFEPGVADINQATP
jgi:signal transduction histidine kinase/DNA-binding response OmpR family regulator